MNSPRLRAFCRASTVPFIGASIAFSAWALAELLPSSWIGFAWESIQSASSIQILMLVALFGFVEAFFPVCHYVPGTILYAAVVGSGVGNLSSCALAFAATGGVLVGLFTSYGLGRFFSNSRLLGLYHPALAKIRENASRLGWVMDVIFSIHPNNIAALMVVYGLTRTPILGHLVIGSVCSGVTIMIGTFTLKNAVDILETSPAHYQLGLSGALFVLGLVLGVRSARRA